MPSEKCKLIQNIVLIAFPFAFNSQNVECIQSEIQRHENSFHYYTTKIRYFKASYKSSCPNSVVKKCSTSLKYVPQSHVSNESCYKKIVATIWLELKSKLEKSGDTKSFLGSLLYRRDLLFEILRANANRILISYTRFF